MSLSESHSLKGATDPGQLVARPAAGASGAGDDAARCSGGDQRIVTAAWHLHENVGTRRGALESKPFEEFAASNALDRIMHAIVTGYHD